MTDDIEISPGPQFKAAMALAIVADVLQILFLSPIRRRGFSPADDILDIGVAAALIHLLGCTGNFCRRSWSNSCPEWIWSRSGRSRGERLSQIQTRRDHRTRGLQ